VVEEVDRGEEEIVEVVVDGKSVVEVEVVEDVDIGSVVEVEVVDDVVEGIVENVAEEDDVVTGPRG